LAASFVGFSGRFASSSASMTLPSRL
jgi:hypothetical protein